MSPNSCLVCVSQKSTGGKQWWQQSTQVSPFQMLYGQEPVLPHEKALNQPRIKYQNSAVDPNIDILVHNSSILHLFLLTKDIFIYKRYISNTNSAPFKRGGKTRCLPLKHRFWTPSCLAMTYHDPVTLEVTTIITCLGDI